MNIKIENLVNHIYTDTGNSLWAFSPELAVCATILLLLFARLFNVDRKGGLVSPAGLTMIGIVAADALTVATQSHLTSGDIGLIRQWYLKWLE